MDYRLDVGMWNQVFAVPAALVDRHLKLAGKEQLQVILWALRHAGHSFSLIDLCGSLDLPKELAQDALDYWCDRGLLAADGALLSPVPQPEPVSPMPPQETRPTPADEPAPPPESAPAPHTIRVSPVPEPDPEQDALQPPEEDPGAPPASGQEPVEPQPEPEPLPASPLPPRKRLARPDGQYLAIRMAESDGIRFLMQEAETTLGKTLSPAMSSLLVAITDDYGLPPEVAVMLLHYVAEIGRTGTSYIDSVARDWAESGIFSIAAAEEKLQALSKLRLAWSRVSAAAGINKRAPSKTEGERANRWVNEWGFSDDMLSAAYDACAEHTGKFSAAYMDKILTSWYQQGIRSLEELEESRILIQKQILEEANAGKSYDIDELAEMSSFLLPQEL